MKAGTEYTLALVTAPNIENARQLAMAALSARLAACVNIIPKIESHYWWKGKLTSDSEVLLTFKTPCQCLADLEQLILQLHPYDTPEFIALSLTAGNERYLKWIHQNASFRPSGNQRKG